MPSGTHPPRVPPGRRLYAVGDIHGRADLLSRLLAEIATDAKCRGPAQNRLVYLGDYVDRGPDSADVIDLVLDGAPAGFDGVTLMGNHEDMMRRFLFDLTIGRGWLMNGADATLRSYGVEPPTPHDDTQAYRRASVELAQHLPPRHRRFLDSLALSHEEGDYFFVHAGVRPGVPLAEQRPEDLVWIRDEFLESDAEFGKRVVHGHSITREPTFRHNRIGIDTGAYATGRLTCLVLEGSDWALLQT